MRHSRRTPRVLNPTPRQYVHPSIWIPQRRRRSLVHSNSSCRLMEFEDQSASEVIFLPRLAPLTSSYSPPAASGPTTSEPGLGRPANTLAPVSILVKHQRPFTSGPKGYTIWYTTASSQPLSSPPASLPVTAGILYIHTNLSKDTKQIWLCNINRSWVDITAVDNAKHPSITDRILLLRSDGIPSWLTGANYAVIQSRKDRSGR